MIWRCGKNCAADIHKPYFCWSVHIRIMLCPISGKDAIVLYERNVSEDNITNKMVFKKNIEEISDCNIRIDSVRHNRTSGSCQWKAAMQ